MAGSQYERIMQHEIPTEQVVGWPKKMAVVIKVLLNLNWIVN